MDTIGKRGRGRPRGTGLDDMATLLQIADMMARVPRLRATTALRRIDPDVNPASKRRIQAKWRAQGQILLAEARARLAPRKEASVPARPNANGGLDHASRVFGDALGSPAPLTATQAAAAEVARRAAQALELAAVGAAMSSPAMRAIRQAYDSPAMRAIREMHDSSSMRAMRDLYDSPAMRAVRELHDSPTMRAIREARTAFGMRG